MVKPRNTDARVSRVWKTTVMPVASPSMVVLAGPAELFTSMALPLKSMRSW